MFPGRRYSLVGKTPGCRPGVGSSRLPICSKHFLTGGSICSSLVSIGGDCLYHTIRRFFRPKRYVKVGNRHEEAYKLWNMDNTLAEIIYEWLVAFKKAPRNGILYSKTVDLIAPREEPVDWEKHDDTEWLLDELIWTFDIIRNGGAMHSPEATALWDAESDKHDYSLDFQKNENGDAVFVSHMWENDEAGRDEYYAVVKRVQERVDSGLKLFAEMFEGLWD